MRIHPAILKQTPAPNDLAPAPFLTPPTPTLARTVSHVLTDLAATTQLAQSLKAQYDWRDAIIELRGDLGAGKTTFARALIQALGVTDHVKSPTYGIVETYTGQGVVGDWWDQLAISHFDFYRFNDPLEWEEAGFRDIFAAPGLKLVEWADKATPLLPAPDAVLTLELQADESRLATLTLNPKHAV